VERFYNYRNGSAGYYSINSKLSGNKSSFNESRKKFEIGVDFIDLKNQLFKKYSLSLDLTGTLKRKGCNCSLFDSCYLLIKLTGFEITQSGVPFDLTLPSIVSLFVLTLFD